MEPIQQFLHWIKESDHIVFFGGAGVSTESGIPDFRSVDGLYHQEYDYPPETILSHTFYMQNTSEFYRFYRKKMLCLDAEPNAAHKKLAELERAGKLKAVITQNIDGLHQAAGSRHVLELHGSVHRNYCKSCGRLFDAEYIQKSKNCPICKSCGGDIKPDVVLYEEGLDDETMRQSIRFISQADMLIVGGTSLAVYPAAGLIDYYRGSKLVLINTSTTPFDHRADLRVEGKIGEVFSAIELQICGHTVMPYGRKEVIPQAYRYAMRQKRGNMQFEIGDIVKLKKKHPCGSHEWEVLRVGADFRLKCLGCGHQIMIARKLVEKNVKEIRKTLDSK